MYFYQNTYNVNILIIVYFINVLCYCMSNDFYPLFAFARLVIIISLFYSKIIIFMIKIKMSQSINRIMTSKWILMKARSNSGQQHYLFEHTYDDRCCYYCYRVFENDKFVASIGKILSRESVSIDCVPQSEGANPCLRWLIFVVFLRV